MDFYGDPTIYVRVLGLFDNYVSKAVYRGPAEDYHYKATANVFAGEQVIIQLGGGELNAAGDAGTTADELKAANDLLLVVQARVAADKAEATAKTALVAEANKVSAKDSTSR
jgi:hypothetical protein